MHASSHVSGELGRLAQLLNDLSPHARALLRAIYVPTNFEDVDLLYKHGDGAMLEAPLNVPVLRHEALCEPLANFAGHILPFHAGQ